MQKGFSLSMDSSNRTDVSPVTASPGDPAIASHLHSSDASFSILAIAVIGILAIAFLLVSYYLFVIRCCLNWQRIDLLRRFSLSRRQEEALAAYAHGTELRGLDEAVIRLIPVIQFNRDEPGESMERSFCECAVCLNEFRQDEKLRRIPNCNHVFHIDCIDVWLQSNANCPLCRTRISLSTRFPLNFTLGPSPRDPISQGDDLAGGEEDFVVIELGGGGHGAEKRESEMQPAEEKKKKKKAGELHKLASMDDDCIFSRGKDESFSVQPVRRSLSMDSSGDRQLYSSVLEALRRQSRQQVDEVSPAGDCSGRVRRSFFPFGNKSRSAILPISSDI